MNQPSEHNLPAVAALQTTMSAFKESQRISEAKAREIEQGTRDQRLFSLWFAARVYSGVRCISVEPAAHYLFHIA